MADPETTEAMMTSLRNLLTSYTTTESVNDYNSTSHDAETTMETVAETSTSGLKGFTGFDTAFLLYVGFLMVIGLLGNLAVFIVFLKRFPQTNYKTFVVCLAAMDFLMCCFGMPKTIMLIRYNEVFQNIATCKIIVFIVKYLAGSSLIILFVIALDRYLKVCHPTKAKAQQFHAKLALVITLSIVFVLMIPALVLYGDQKTTNGTTKSTCTVPDTYTTFNKVFEGYLLIIVLLIFGFLSVSYSLIWKQIVKRRKFFDKKKPELSQPKNVEAIRLDATSSTVDSQPSTKEVSVTDANTDHRVEYQPMGTSGKNGQHSKDPKRGEGDAKRKTKGRKREGKTYILFLVTVITVCSWIPHFTMEIILTSNQNLYATISPGVLFVCRFFFFSYYWNTIANPFLYGLCDTKFRTELKSLTLSILRTFSMSSRKTFNLPN